MTPLKAISIFVFIILVVGFAYRRRRKVHVPLMLSAFAIDMGLVAYIEFNRKAIKTAQSIITSDANAGPGPLMTIHIIMSVIVVLLYFWQIYTGIGKLRGRRNASHPYTGITFLLLRFGNLVTSFMVTSAH